MKYIPILELPILIVMVLIRSVMLRRQGTKVIVFGMTDKTDYIIVPIVVLFFYGILSTILDLPFPAILKTLYWATTAQYICAMAVCTASLIWFAITLKTFGTSFRVGIDEKTLDKLITNGTFSISRNPIYVAFITFFIGIFVAYPSIVTTVFLIIITITIHRQILREETFLKTHYGTEYEEYCKRVRRYF